MPELRKDPIVGRWVIISVERSRRPKNIARTKQNSPEPGCLLCLDNSSSLLSEKGILSGLSQSAHDVQWQACSLPDTNPALRMENPPERKGKGVFDTIRGVGTHEIIVEDPERCGNIAHLTEEQIGKVLACFVDRVKKMEGDPRSKYVLIYKDYEPHSKKLCFSQLIAMPVAPKRIREKLIGARNYFQLHERCIFCDIIKQETREQKRIVAENDQFIALVPFASRFPFEILILPKQHSHDIAVLGGNAQASAAAIIKNILLKFEQGLGDPSYSMIFYFSPYIEKKAGHWKTIEEDYHVHIEIIPRLTNIAGFEWGAGFFICPIAPEDAALYLRETEVCRG